MVLTHEQLIPLFKGALRVEMSATGYTAPRRFTEKGKAAAFGLFSTTASPRIRPYTLNLKCMTSPSSTT